MRKPAHRDASKQRVLAAVDLAESDRVPMDFLPNPWVMQRLHNEWGTSTHRELLQRLRSDIVDLRGVVDPEYRGPVPLSRDLGDGMLENFWGWRQKVIPSASGPEDCFVEFVLADAVSIDDLQRHGWPSADWFDFSDLHARLAEWQDFAVMASGASAFQHPTFLRRIDQLLSDMAHNHGAKFLFHSCGAIRPVIEDLIEIGVDILDPLQAAAEGMDPQQLKDTYRDRICLHGGICTQYLLPQGTPDQVQREVRRRVEILGRGGGYILAPCHVLQTDVPIENILAMSDAGAAVADGTAAQE